MKRMLLGLALTAIMIPQLYAQDDFDDIYYNPNKKENSVKSNSDNQKKNNKSKKNKDSNYIADFGDIDVDEYNRRGFYYETPIDTIGEKVENAEDFVYTQQIQKYYNPTVVVQNADVLTDLLLNSYGNVNIIIEDNYPKFCSIYSGSYGWLPGYYNWYYRPGWTWSYAVGPSWTWTWNLGNPWDWFPNYYYPIYRWGYGPGWVNDPFWGYMPGWGYQPPRPGNHRPNYHASNTPSMNRPSNPRPGWGSNTRPQNATIDRVSGNAMVRPGASRPNGGNSSSGNIRMHDGNRRGMYSTSGTSTGTSRPAGNYRSTNRTNSSASASETFKTTATERVSGTGNNRSSSSYNRESSSPARSTSTYNTNSSSYNRSSSSSSSSSFNRSSSSSSSRSSYSTGSSMRSSGGPSRSSGGGSRGGGHRR